MPQQKIYSIYILSLQTVAVNYFDCWVLEEKPKILKLWSIWNWLSYQSWLSYWELSLLYSVKDGYSWLKEWGHPGSQLDLQSCGMTPKTQELVANRYLPNEAGLKCSVKTMESTSRDHPSAVKEARTYRWTTDFKDKEQEIKIRLSDCEKLFYIDMCEMNML